MQKNVDGSKEVRKKEKEGEREKGRKGGEIF